MLDRDTLEYLLEQVARGEIAVKDALARVKILPYEDIGFAKIDHHRGLRDVFPEVVYCPGKTPEQVAAIIGRLAETSNRVLATRASADIFDVVRAEVPDAAFHPVARLITVLRGATCLCGRAAVITAGTSDLPVAEETAVSLELMGAEVVRIYDVGVAGIHRLLDWVDEMNRVQVLVVVAGMEGALASVVGGLSRRPVIAVPTSVGYGANFGGLSALLSMLNTCAPGVGVVNIDNGFGAAALAFSILRCRED